METRRLGRTEMNVTVLGFGAAEIGLQKIDQATATRLLNIALDSGINVIDTAECYGNSEALIGVATAHRSKDFFLFTKCGHAVETGETAWSRQTIVEGVERSLRRLKRDYVDLLQLHSCPFELLKQGDVIEALEEVRRSGKTRFIGCSADGNAAAYAVNTGRFDVLQTSFNIADQDALDRNFADAHAIDMGIVVKRPIANAAWKYQYKPADPWLHVYWERIELLDYAFLKQADESRLAHALRFALTPHEVGTAIVGTINSDHLRSNLRQVEQNRLDALEFDQIRARWKACGGSDWPGKG